MIDLLINFDKEEDKKKLFSIMKVLKGEHAVSIKKKRTQRSGSQNRYYWSVVIGYISEETGYTKEEAHQAMQRLFLRYDKEMPNGDVETFVRSTTSLNTLEMTEYIESIRTFALSDLGCYIPEPSEIIYEK
jgi:iron uptake system EfeUOB component EfeO/EfeM